MGEIVEFRPSNKIGEMLVSPRSLAEYRAMFALTDEDLTRSILDCPGGAASFTAEVNGAGGRVTACDPIYARPARVITDLSHEDLRRARGYIRRNPDEFVWRFFDGPEVYRASRSRSVEMFLADLADRPGRYVAAAIPTLPFADRAFDLALSSHLLFSYADRLDRAFHLDGIRELTRVATEVRVFPLVPMGFTANPDLPSMVAELNSTGFRATVHTVGYELQRGATRMLRVVRD
jgi:SAM-dependent methyltransferase